MESIQAGVRELLLAVGEDPEREGMELEGEEEQNKLWLQKFKKMKAGGSSKANSIHRTKSYK